MKSVLMPPVPVHEVHGATDLRKAKTVMLRSGRATSGSISDQLLKHEWEQVGNSTVDQTGKEDAA